MPTKYTTEIFYNPLVLINLVLDVLSVVLKYHPLGIELNNIPSLKANLNVLKLRKIINLSKF
jgi:hypothetical protein